MVNIPKRIVGFLTIEGKKLPFELDKEKFELRLYQPTESDTYEQIYEGIKFYGAKTKEHKWADRITLKGNTAEDYTIYVNTVDSYSSYHGFRIYRVYWYYLTDEDPENLDEIRFSGREINFFCDPARTFVSKVVCKDENKTAVKSLSVQTVECEDWDCGHYSAGDVLIEVSCATTATLSFHSEIPMESKSTLRLKFSKGVSLEETISIARNVTNFVTYICYRNNCQYSDISTFIKDQDGKVRNCGKLVFNVPNNEETNEKAKERIIKVDYLGIHTADILSAIGCEKLSYGHICDSIKNMSHYPVSRIIMVLAAFEREFRNIYGQDVRRSDDYKNTKAEAVKLLKDYAVTLTGKKKKYVKGFADGIANSDSSYGDNLKYALEDCKSIMEIFVTSHFNGNYEEIIDDVSTSVNGLRNGVAHSRLDLELQARHLADVKIVEEMLYVIRLKHIGVDENTVKKAINDLFRENLSIM